MVVDTSHLNCSDLYQLNLTNDVERASKYLIEPSSRVIALVVQVLALLIGIPGNVSFLVAVARVGYMKTTTNVFLVSLAIADITFLLFTVTSYLLYLPAPVRSHIHSQLNLGCVVAFGVPFLTYFASVATVWLVSAERYFAICHPFRHLAVNSKRRAVRLVVAAWVISLALSGLAVVQYASPVRICATWPGGDETEEDLHRFADLPDIIGFCLPLGPWAVIVGNLSASLPFMVALVVSAVMYVRIVQALNQRSVTKDSEEEEPQMSNKARLIRNQVAGMLVINGTVFFVCQLPYAIINFVYIGGYLRGMSFVRINELQNDLRIISHSLLFVNSAVNPIIYYARCPSYRQALRIAWRPTSSSSSSHGAPKQTKLSVDTGTC